MPFGSAAPGISHSFRASTTGSWQCCALTRSRSASSFLAGSSVELFQLDPFVVLLQDLLVRRPVQRHAERTDLAHADAVSPAAAEERHAEHAAGGVALDVEREQA